MTSRSDNDFVEKWRLAAADWLDKQEAADILRETKLDVFAEIKSRMDAKSEAEKDRLARVHQDWHEYRTKMLDAENTARRAKFRVKFAEMEFDAWRSEGANARTERKMY